MPNEKLVLMSSIEKTTIALTAMTFFDGEAVMTGFKFKTHITDTSFYINGSSIITQMETLLLKVLKFHKCLCG